MKNAMGRLEVNRFSVPFKVHGESGPVIVCVNDSRHSMDLWNSQVSRYSRSHTVVTFDFPGQGTAEAWSGSRRASIAEKIEILKEVVAVAAKGRPVHLFGASSGGIVAAGYASKNPDRVMKWSWPTATAGTARPCVN